MSTITFDTHQIIRELREADFTEKQAETVVRIISKSQEGLVNREHFDNKLEILEYRLTIKVGGMIAAAVAITAALVKLL